ncbi:unnamed protein product, partial [Musa textilis]
MRASTASGIALPYGWFTFRQPYHPPMRAGSLQGPHRRRPSLWVGRHARRRPPLRVGRRLPTAYSLHTGTLP